MTHFGSAFCIDLGYTHGVTTNHSKSRQGNATSEAPARTKMDTKTGPTTNSPGLRRQLGHKAVNLALEGEWERASEVNKAMLELFGEDVETMNRLAKALIEVGNYGEAKGVLDRVCEIAPYNNIAKKNRTRLEQHGDGRSSGNQTKKSTGLPRLFIEESGKSSTTVLRGTAGRPALALVYPGDPVNLVQENNTVNAYSGDGEYLGQLEPKIGKRLAGLIRGGNTYAAAVIGVSDQGISIIIRETYRQRSMQHVCSFPTRTAETPKFAPGQPVARSVKDEESEDDDEDDEEENVIDEEAIETGWTDNE